MKRHISIIIISIALIGLATFFAVVRMSLQPLGNAEAGSPLPGFPKAIDAKFACAAGKSVSAEFVTGKVALRLSDGRWFELPQAISASGARYASPGDAIVFWNKGNTAFITENGKTTYDGCVTDGAK